VRGDGGFELRSVRSTDPGVLDYYELAGRRRRSGPWWTLELARPVRFERLDLAASAHGRRVLVAGGNREALHPARGTSHVRIAVER